MKSLVWMEWTERQCTDVPIIIKVDIDTVVDVVGLVDAVEITIVLEPNADATLACKVEKGEAAHCVDDVYIMNNYTRGTLLEHMRSKRYWDLEPHYVSVPLASDAGVALVSADKTITLDSGRMVKHGGSREKIADLWLGQRVRHDLGDVPLAYNTSFVTTSYENYVIENADYCRSAWPEVRTLIVVHSNPSQEDFRDNIRNTWGSIEMYQRLQVRPLFFLGRSPDPEGATCVRICQGWGDCQF
jgi:hypothetical protein